MSVESLIAATEASAASATTTEEPKVAPPTTEVPAEGTQQPVEGQPEVPETPVPAETAEVETEPDLDATPETSGDFAKYKPLFTEHPELRNIIGREKAFSELGPFSEVREIVQRIPTLEDAETLASQAENLKEFSETFRGSPAQFAERLQELDKPAFVELVKALQSPEVLENVAPHLLRERVQSDVHRALEATYAQARTDEERAALQIVARMWNYREPAVPQQAPVNSELEKLKREKAERENADRESRFNSFYAGTDDAIISTSVAEIQTGIRKAYPQVNEEQLKTLTERAWKNVTQSVNAQPQTRAQVQRYLDDAKKGRDSLQQQKALVSFVTGRNSKQIPVAVKEAVSWLTKQIISTNVAQIDKRKAIAQTTKDVGTGVQGTTSAAAGAPPTPQKKTFNSVMERLNNEAAALRSGAAR